jgi:iron complex transport system substrate-binding protein
MYRLIFFLLIAILGCTPPAMPPVNRELPPQRIVSTLPSITEVLFDIGLGDRIVGVSAFTKYPPEAAVIDKIGGQFDINYEKIISLKPDLIILSIENQTRFQSLSIPVLIVNHQTFEGVLDSYLVIGTAFGEKFLTVAQTKQQDLIAKMSDLETKKETPPIRTLICIDRSRGTGQIQNLYVAGANSFLSEVVERAGGENVAASIGLLAPTLSAEGIIHLSPDVIIDIQVDGTDTARSVSDWQSLSNSVPAVRNRRILTLTEDFASIPGPRTPLLLEKIVQYFESIQP